jgi:hypothetical protein
MSNDTIWYRAATEAIDRYLEGETDRDCTPEDMVQRLYNDTDIADFVGRVGACPIATGWEMLRSLINVRYYLNSHGCDFSGYDPINPWEVSEVKRLHNDVTSGMLLRGVAVRLVGETAWDRMWEVIRDQGLTFESGAELRLWAREECVNALACAIENHTEGYQQLHDCTHYGWTAPWLVLGPAGDSREEWIEWARMTPIGRYL